MKSNSAIILHDGNYHRDSDNNLCAVARVYSSPKAPCCLLEKAMPWESWIKSVNGILQWDCGLCIWPCTAWASVARGKLHRDRKYVWKVHLLAPISLTRKPFYNKVLFRIARRYFFFSSVNFYEEWLDATVLPILLLIACVGCLAYFFPKLECCYLVYNRSIAERRG